MHGLEVRAAHDKYICHHAGQHRTIPEIDQAGWQNGAQSVVFCMTCLSGGLQLSVLHAVLEWLCTLTTYMTAARFTLTGIPYKAINPTQLKKVSFSICILDRR